MTSEKIRPARILTEMKKAAMTILEDQEVAEAQQQIAKNQFNSFII